MSHTDRPETPPKDSAADAALQKLHDDSFPFPALMSKNAQIPGYPEVLQLPAITITHASQMRYDKTNGNLITDERQVGGNLSQVSEVDANNDRLLITTTKAANGSIEGRSVATYHPDGSYTDISSINKPVLGIEKTALVQQPHGGALASIEIDPKTNKPYSIFIADSESQIDLDPQTGKPTKVTMFGPDKPFRVVDFDPHTGKPNQVTLGSGYDADVFAIDPASGKATAQPLQTILQRLDYWQKSL
jgi:hypothetical protein